MQRYFPRQWKYILRCVFSDKTKIYITWPSLASYTNYVSEKQKNKEQAWETQSFENKARGKRTRLRGLSQVGHGAWQSPKTLWECPNFIELMSRIQAPYGRCLHLPPSPDANGMWFEKRANCSRKVREIESRYWEGWIGWQGWRMIICKRSVPPDDHLQEARSSGLLFARGRILWMIICEWPIPQNDHLQVARSFEWSFARGWILQMVICKRPDSPDDLLKEAGSSGWSFASGQIHRMVICKRLDPLDDNF